MLSGSVCYLLLILWTLSPFSPIRFGKVTPVVFMQFLTEYDFCLKYGERVSAAREEVGMWAAPSWNN